MTSPEMLDSFTKYSELGAYHWPRAITEPWYRRSPRLAARYDIPLHFITKCLQLPLTRGVDIGCGDGVFLYKASTAGGHIIGIDSSQDGITLARNELGARDVSNVELISSSCYDTPLAAESCDYAVAIELIEHLDNPQWLLREVNRILRPGGLFICTTPHRAANQHPDEVRDPFHVHEYSATELQTLLMTHLSDAFVYGAYPQWLDAWYGVDSFNPLTKLRRIMFRAVAFGLANPYVLALGRNPSPSWQLLVGVASRRGRTHGS